MFNIAYMYEHGLGVTRNFYTAERFYAIASKLEMNAKMLISLVLFRIRIKSIWQTIINSIKAFINLFMSIFSTTLIEAISKNGFDLIVEERETIFIIMAAIIIVIITRTHLH
uniref:Protein sel-1 homolog 2 (Trinotate prediction) n=1 Tax=Myxobolus squamalis TaxID=59785 RepID=A0A6B2G511_MYXSQ